MNESFPWKASSNQATVCSLWEINESFLFSLNDWNPPSHATTVIPFPIYGSNDETSGQKEEQYTDEFRNQTFETGQFSILRVRTSPIDLGWKREKAEPITVSKRKEISFVLLNFAPPRQDIRREGRCDEMDSICHPNLFLTKMSHLNWLSLQLLLRVISDIHQHTCALARNGAFYLRFRSSFRVRGRLRDLPLLWKGLC